MSYNNWPEICREGRKHPALIAFIATLESRGEFSERFKRAFPEFFSETEVRGPIPLSLLLSTYEDGNDGEPASQEGISSVECFYELDIPFLDFKFREENIPPLWASEERVVLPMEVAERCKFRGFVQWKERSFFVAYASKTASENYITLIPAECIDTDL